MFCPGAPSGAKHETRGGLSRPPLVRACGTHTAVIVRDYVVVPSCASGRISISNARAPAPDILTRGAFLLFLVKSMCWWPQHWRNGRRRAKPEVPGRRPKSAKH